MMKVERRYELLYGGELQERITENPTAWVPLGILEKHGDHLPWGLDGLKAHGVCLFLAEHLGGVVFPATHVAGVHEPWDPDPKKNDELQAEVGDFYVRQSTLKTLLADIISGLVNIGFKVIVLYSGHYPELQQQVIAQVADTAERKHAVEVIPFTEWSLFGEGDHAGKWESSIYMALGGKVRSDAIKDEMAGRIGYPAIGADPKDASREFGDRALNVILQHFRGLFYPNPYR